jgi:hypothetical protein
MCAKSPFTSAFQNQHYSSMYRERLTLPYLNMLCAPEHGDTSELAMATELLHGRLIPNAPHGMTDHYILRQWLIKILRAQLSWLVDLDS